MYEMCDKHFFHSFILAINIYLRAYYAYNTVLGTGFTVENKTEGGPCLHRAGSLMGKTNTYTNRHLIENCDECCEGKYRVL